jgi:hypothetical protein
MGAGQILACLLCSPAAALTLTFLPGRVLPPALQVFNEDRKQINGLLLVHLPDGPTAQFRMSNLKLSSDIKVGAWAVGWRGLGWAVGTPAAACMGAAAMSSLSCNVRKQSNHAPPCPRLPAPHTCRAMGAPPATAPSWC